MVGEAQAQNNTLKILVMKFGEIMLRLKSCFVLAIKDSSYGVNKRYHLTYLLSSFAVVKFWQLMSL